MFPIHKANSPAHVLSHVNTGLSSFSNTAQDAQLAIGQQTGVLQTQLTGLMIKVNEHINFRFQQLEENYLIVLYTVKVLFLYLVKLLQSLNQWLLE